MTYENGKQYTGVFGGIKVTFTLENFSEQVVEKFNRLLVEKALEQQAKEVAQ